MQSAKSVWGFRKKETQYIKVGEPLFLCKEQHGKGLQQNKVNQPGLNTPKGMASIQVSTDSISPQESSPYVHRENG